MRPEGLKQSIQNLLADNTRQPLTESEIAGELGVRGKARKHLQKYLQQLVKRGDIVVVRKTRFALGRPADLVTGELQVVRSGNAYLDPREGGRSVFVRRDDVGTALPGDRVVVRLKRGDEVEGDRCEGRVIRVLERRKRQIVGTLKSTSRLLCVVPIDPAYTRDFYVPDACGANEGDRVVVEVVGWDNRHVNPEAEIVEVLGPADRPDMDTLSVIRDHELRDAFPEEVLREAETVAGRVDRPGERADLRDTLIVTIDPARARDFDDALSLERDKDGQRVLGVHIADVSHFVRKGSALDREARERGTSVYLPDKVLPMLPEQLSNGVCSLRPDEDRLAFSAFLTVNASGTVTGRRFARSRIRSRRRLTYAQALAVLSGERKEGVTLPEMGNDEVALLKDLHALAQQFRKRRYARHALALEVPECEVVLDDEGRMTGLQPVLHDVSHQLVEECMIAANEAVAVELHHRACPSIARYHAPPDETKIEEVAAELVALGYAPGNLNVRRNLADFLRSVEGDPLAYHVRTSVLRSMKRAVYSADDAGHYGLAKKFYLHFTSPIRRYPDLASHRQLAAVLTRQPPVYQQRALATVARNCSEREEAAEKAERTVLEMKKYRYLEAQIEEQRPETYDASVTKVVNFGLFIDLPDLQVSGMVHVSAISPDEFVRYSKRTNSLRAGSCSYGVGDRLRVYPVRVDFAKRQIDFGLAEEPGRKRPQKRGQQRGQKRGRGKRRR